MGVGGTKAAKEAERWQGFFLASRGEAVVVGDCNTEILVRIYWGIVDADFVVKMGSGGASALAYIADDVSAVYALASRHGVTGKVSVAGADPVSVINHDGLAVAAHDITEGHDSVGGCNNLGAVVAPISTPLWNAPSPLNGSMRSPKLPVTWPSTGQRLGAEFALNQSAVVALRVKPIVRPTMVAPVKADVRKACNWSSEELTSAS